MTGHLSGHYVHNRALAGQLIQLGSAKAKETLSTSSSLSYLGCAQRYRLAKEEGLRSPMRGASAQSGTLGHMLLANAYARAFTTGTQAAIAGVSYDVHQWVAEQEVQHAARLKARALGVANVGDAAEVASVTASVTRRTMDKYLADDLARYELVGTELPVRRLVPGLRGIASTGVLDLVLFDRRANTVVVMDHKFVAEKPSGWIDGAYYDPQRPAYFWHVTQAFPGVHVEFTYNVIRRKVPSIPKIVSGGKRFSESPCDTTGDAYRDLVRQNPHLANDPVYLERVPLLDAEDTFNARATVPTTKAQVDNWLSELRDVVRARRVSKRTGVWTKNRAECNGIFGLCPFRGICEEDTPTARAPFMEPPTASSESQPGTRDDFEAPF